MLPPSHVKLCKVDLVESRWTAWHAWRFCEATVLASYLEIYNEKIYDLLTGTHKASGTNQAITYLAYSALLMQFSFYVYSDPGGSCAQLLTLMLCSWHPGKLLLSNFRW